MKQLRRCRKICKAYSAGTAKLGTDGASETAVIVVNGFLGGEGNPWEIGEDVTAYVKDHVICLQGEGTVTELGGDGAPWAKYGEMLEGAYLARKVKVSASVAATLPISVKGGVGNPMD